MSVNPHGASGELEMNPTFAMFALGLAILLSGIFFSAPAWAQATGATLSGTITAPSGAVVPSAKVSLKNVASGQSVDAQTDLVGHYSLANLRPGEYQLSVVADGYAAYTTNVTMAAGAIKTVDVALSGSLSLGDLGFSPDQTRGSAADQARLDKRSHMLKLHQRFGLIATVPLIATLAASVNAGGRNTSATDRNLHVALGAATGDLYGISAWYAIRAPKIPGTPTRGPIRVHKILAWIHGPGMILTPILGAMAYNQKNNGERVHGIAKAHGPVAIVTAAAYGAAILSVSIKF